jgi:hypothetical protein
MAVYVIQPLTGHGNMVKIGYSIDPDKRINDLQTGSASLLSLRHCFRRGSQKMESGIHDTYSEFRHRGEWFRYTGHLRSIIEACSRDDVNNRMVTMWYNHYRDEKKYFIYSLFARKNERDFLHWWISKKVIPEEKWNILEAVVCLTGNLARDKNLQLLVGNYDILPEHVKEEIMSSIKYA